MHQERQFTSPAKWRWKMHSYRTKPTHSQGDPGLGRLCRLGRLSPWYPSSLPASTVTRKASLPHIIIRSIRINNIIVLEKKCTFYARFMHAFARKTHTKCKELHILCTLCARFCSILVRFLQKSESPFFLQNRTRGFKFWFYAHQYLICFIVAYSCGVQLVYRSSEILL